MARFGQRMIGVGCASGAVALGMVYLTLAGAPPRALIVNGVALAVGLILLAVQPYSAIRPNLAALAGASALLATAIGGVGVDGITRWVKLGPLLVQPALVLLPALTIAFARMRDGLGVAAIGLAAVALALQPDRAMAGSLAAATAISAIVRTERTTITAAAVALAGFAIALLRPDNLPPEPFVEGVIASAVATGPIAALAVSAGLLLLLAPAVAGWRSDPEGQDAALALGTIWLAVIAAAAVGNSPTPIVGYGGSAILGYALSLAALPRRADR